MKAIKNFSEIGRTDNPFAGEKNAFLRDMFLRAFITRNKCTGWICCCG